MKKVCVQTYLNRPSAEGARMALESEGIEVEIFADDAGGMRPELSMQKGVKILVKEENAAVAKQILQACEQQAKPSSSDEDAGHSGGFLTKLRKWIQG